MSHGPVTWRETPSDRVTYGKQDTRRMAYDFFAVYEKTTPPGTTPPATASEAIVAAETAGANLRVDGSFVPPSSLTGPGSPWILSSLEVKRLPNTNSSSDVVWVFTAKLEYADRASTTEPFVTVTTNAASASVSAFRIYPTIPTDDFTSLQLNYAVWHGPNDIGGRKVDWASQPIQYALPLRTSVITIQRPAPIWDAAGNRDVGAINSISSDAQYIGMRNTSDLGWIGDVGYALLTSVNMQPLNDGLYSVAYTFRWHPWKHAIQVPFMVGGSYAKLQNAANLTRLQNANIWWSQPHLEGEDFKANLDITTDEWAAAGVT